MQYKLVIEGRLPGLNDYQLKCRTHYSEGNKMKQECENIVSLYIMQQLRIPTITKKVFIEFRWYEPNRKRDYDNVSSFGRKCIQDALVACKILKNDGWKYIQGFKDEFYLDKEHPRIEVVITETEISAK